MYGGSRLSENQKNELVKKSTDFNIENATILIEQGLALNDIDDKNIELFKLKEQIINLNTALNKKNMELDSILIQQKFGQTLLSEIKTIFPQIQGCLYSESLNFNDTFTSPQITPVVILSVKSRIQDADKTKLNNWLRQRLKNNSVKIYYE